LFSQDESHGGRDDVIELTDSDDSLDRMVWGLRNHVHCACCHKPIRRTVFALPAVRAVPFESLGVLGASSPIRIGVRSRDNIDRANRAAYMRDWQAKAKRQHVEARDVARLTPRRSPRLEASSD